VIKRDVLGLGRLREYELARVKGLRVAQHASVPFGSPRSMRSWGTGPGLISFDYGAKTFHFAIGADASPIASTGTSLVHVG
jgi:hypothetical protein